MTFPGYFIPDEVTWKTRMFVVVGNLWVHKLEKGLLLALACVWESWLIYGLAVEGL